MQVNDCFDVIQCSNIIMAEQHQQVIPKSEPIDQNPPSPSKHPKSPHSAPHPSPNSIFDLSSHVLGEMGPHLKKQALRHHQIIGRISAGTFSADKLIRLISNTIKVIRNFKLIADMRALERVAGQLSQMRRLLRVDRLCMVIRDYWGCVIKERLSGLDYFMIVFRAVIVMEDCSDALAYLIQLKLVNWEGALGELRKRIADLYFFECIGWLLYYSYEYVKADSEEGKRRNRIVIVRYVLDIVISHNDFSGRRMELGGKMISVLGVISSLLNLLLIWK